MTDALRPTVETLPDADPTMSRIAARYWATTASDNPRGWAWTESELDLADDYGIGRSPLPYVVASVVRAHVPGTVCGQCAGPLTLLRRDTVADLRDVSHCVDCEPGLPDKIADAISATARERYRATVPHSRRQLYRRQARREWEQRQQQILGAQMPPYPLRSYVDPEQIAAASVTAQVAALTLLSHADVTGQVPATASWSHPFAPSEQLEHKLLSEAFWGGLLAIHPAAGDGHVIWAQTFEQAWDECDGNPAAMPEPVSADLDYRRASWYVPAPADHPEPSYQTTIRAAAGALHLHEQSTRRREELIDLCFQLLIEETLRFYEQCLHDAGQPRLADEHNIDAFRDAAAHFLIEHTLEDACELAYLAAATAARLASKHNTGHGQGPVIYGARRFAELAHQRRDEPAEQIRITTMIRQDVADTWASHCTRSLFQLIGAHPGKTSVTAAIKLIPPAASDRDEAWTADITHQLRSILHADDLQAVYGRLRMFTSHPDPAVAVAARQLVTIADDFRLATGDQPAALTAAACAARLISTRLFPPAEPALADLAYQTSRTVGEYLFKHLTETTPDLPPAAGM